MKSKWTKPVLDSLIHVLAWCLAWVVVLICFSDSPSRYAYATLSAWWCSLYVGYIREIGLRTLLPLFVINIGETAISLTYGLGWFLGRHDAFTLSEVTSGILILAIAGPYVILSSPILINSTVRYVISRGRG